MNIVKPYAKLLSPIPWESEFSIVDGISQLRRIEWFGRISHRSEDKMTDTSWDRFIIANVLQHGDWSIVEHGVVSVDFYVDRGITHEIVRHRLFSFTQESTRFCNYGKKQGEINVIQPEFDNETSRVCWADSTRKAEEEYLRLLGVKISPQIARSVLPNSLASRIGVTGNLRNWRHFLIMRTTAESHPQMREVTIPLLAEFKLKIPLLFDDIRPNEKQSLALGKIR